MPLTLVDVGSLFLSEKIALELEPLTYEGGHFRLPEYKVISVSGLDARAFLHNQTINNVNNLENYSFQLDAVLDLSAKLIGFFEVLKESDDQFYILIHEDLSQSTIERLDKYLIAEDVDLTITEKELFGIIGAKATKLFPKGFKGIFAEEEVIFSFDKPSNNQVDQNLFNKLITLTGYPMWNRTQLELELVNNTRIIDLAYDKEKGCFLGQETVAKIETRRGAAYKPVILENSTALNAPAGAALIGKDKKVGKLITNFEQYTLASIGREYRIENVEIELIDPTATNAKVKYLPLYTHTEKAEAFYHHGVEMFQKGDENEAELFLLRAIDCDPSSEDAYESLGVLYGRQDRFEEAIEYMEKLSKLNPKSVMAHTNMSLYLMKLGKIDEAEEQKSQATIKQFEQYGEEAENKKRREEAEKRKAEEIKKREEMFRQVLEIDPEDTLANYGLGEIEFEKGNFEQSITHLKAAIEGKKNYSVAWLALGKSYMKTNQAELAKETFKRGIEIAGKNGDSMPANEMQRLLGTL